MDVWHNWVGRSCFVPALPLQLAAEANKSDTEPIKNFLTEAPEQSSDGAHTEGMMAVCGRARRLWVTGDRQHLV